MAKIPENPTPGRMWGRALRSTPDEIVKAAQVTPEDVEGAKRLFNAGAPDEAKNLIGRPKRKGRAK
jgi:hypothetical protein